MPLRAVLFDVDFTLIEPGPAFRAEGYEAFCSKYGIAVDTSRFGRGVLSAARLLEESGTVYDAELFVRYTAHIIEAMGGSGPRVTECAREIYDEWASCHHFQMYDDVPDVLRGLAASGMKIGLISNSHRSLSEFESHFELNGLISAAVSSSEHGRMKPHASIFEAALRILGVPARNAVMVGDTLSHDIEGALGAGLRAVLLHRSAQPHKHADELAARGVPVIASLDHLPKILKSLDF